MNCENGMDHVARRMCMLAAGLLPSPQEDKDNGTNTITSDFRPFSARDSHVVSQMKRSVEGASRLSLSSSHYPLDSQQKTNSRLSNDDNDQSTTTTTAATQITLGVRTTKLVFDSALQAGKAARSPKTVPLLHDLRLTAGTKTTATKNTTTLLMAEAANLALELAVEPIVVCVCVGRWRVLKDGGSSGGGLGRKIGEMRDGARRRMMETTRVGGLDEKKLKRLLHGPTIELREGKVVDLDVVLGRIEREMMDGGELYR
eukprot:CAMPEP_0198277358 /NCGR_PEP_ID=MMETSP1447-20131203/65808_1 /TAXON_ID=420782 /ORGANISM="Chaetoceros dichaeta, Strain CCMP1751" /LENGTH=257 /DNA_ID=CAMNT_0043972377 /DNA_START=1368 /DNA_END=2142 /DNA_ORIENTATION=-